MAIKKQEFFDRANRIKWQPAFSSQHEAILIRPDFIRVLGVNYHSIEELTKQIEKGEEDILFLKESFKKWKELLNNK